MRGNRLSTSGAVRERSFPIALPCFNAVPRRLVHGCANRFTEGSVQARELCDRTVYWCCDDNAVGPRSR